MVIPLIQCPLHDWLLFVCVSKSLQCCINILTVVNSFCHEHIHYQMWNRLRAILYLCICVAKVSELQR